MIRISKVLVLGLMASCGGSESESESETTTTSVGVEWECVITEKDPNYSHQVGCFDDFLILASEPLDASIPGAYSGKTIIDQMDGDKLYFQNSTRYQIHWDFASANLSGNGLPLVADLSGFNTTEYYSPDRRFLLGAVTYYEEPKKWVYEISPYDTASAEMITSAYWNIVENAYFGHELHFHPTSEAVEIEAAKLDDDILQITTEELFEGITYQPLNLATSMGKLTFYSPEELEETIPSYREIVVLKSVPNDIAIVSGIITGEFQTPLSHINVLSQNRGTPNMALIGAFENKDLLALEGKWIELQVDAMDYSIAEVTQEEADVWWDENKPDPLEVTPMDTSVNDLRDAESVLDLEKYSLSDALTHAVPVFGGKGSHFGGLTNIGEDVPMPKGFVIPVHFYNQHMEQAGLWPLVEKMLANKEFQGDLQVRYDTLTVLREAIFAADIDPVFLQMVKNKMNLEYPGERCRFRSSTNAEDISGFNGAGLYTSKSGDPNDDDYPVEDAIRTVWASLWNFRAYEERAYFSIPHTDIGMALLVHHSFADEDANGVAITANIYDTTGLEPGFYVNVQEGGESVVLPEAGNTTDQFIYYYNLPGQPIVFMGHSNLIPEGETVLTTSETYKLGKALDAIHWYFYEVYGANGGFYGMDVEFKFDSPFVGGDDDIYIKQARPYPGWGA
jgi:hypothetical protein